MKLTIGQEWVSEFYPHESFRITSGVIDTCSDAYDYERHHDKQFDEHPESTKIFIWERYDKESFQLFLNENVKSNDSSYPFAWDGDCKKTFLVKRIRKFEMKLNQ